MKWIRYYHQNRKQIGRIVLIILSAFILLRFVNYLYKIKGTKESVPQNTIQNVEANTKATTLTTNESVVTGKGLSSNQLETATTTIDNFFSYCNNQEIEKAYQLLTKECKEEIYTTQEIFEKAYYQNVFENKRKNCTIENWVDDTYKVKITEDLLSTGRNDNRYAKQDYITVKKEDGEYKLNINNYIGHEEINETTEKDNIKIEVLCKNTYMEYEAYTIRVTNNTESQILLDSLTNVKSLYIQDKVGNKYSSYSHELDGTMLTLESGQIKTITIKFYSSFVSTKRIQNMVFSDLILKNNQLSERVEFKIEL